MEKAKLLVNLPSGFRSAPILQATWERLENLAEVRYRSHDTAEEIAPDLSWADAVLMWGWPSYTIELLNAAPNLRWGGHLDILQVGARVALQKGLAISVTRRGFSPAVAEMALALVLSTLRKISTYHAAMWRGEESWVSRFPDDIAEDERQLTNRSVGIIGFGAVGRRLGELLAPFQTDLRIYDPFLPQEIAQAHNAQRVELNELLERSDVVVLCAASNEGTKHLLGREEIALLRHNAVFVNVARAALVDTDALINRLERGDLYAALDVFDLEPLELDSALRALPNAYLTPHRAGGISASVERIVAWLADDFEAHLNGQPLKYPLTEKMLPALDA